MSPRRIWCISGPWKQAWGAASFCRLACLALLLPAVNAAAQGPAQLRADAFERAYNLDYAAAAARLDEALALAADDDATHRAIAAVTWQEILFIRGAITVDYYAGSVSRPRVDLPPPPPALDRRFHAHIQRAITLARHRVARGPKSAESHYALGAGLGLQASYTGSVLGQLRAGFRAAREAFHAHERALQLDPSRHESALTVGVYRYLVSTLSAPARWMAYLAGFGGGRERGLRLIEQAAAQPSDAQSDARFALVLIYNRERRFEDALRVIRELRARFPRNRLLTLEYGSTALRAGRTADADAVLSEGISALASDLRPRAGGEVAMWRYKRGAVRVALKRLDEASADLDAALAEQPPRWIRGRITLEQGRITEARGDRRKARDQYHRAAALCEAERDGPCTREAKHLAGRR